VRLGYLPLVGAVLAFSVYQGVSAPKKNGDRNVIQAGSGQKAQPSSGAGADQFPGTDALAKIEDGVCQCKIDETWKDPCKDCGPICPASGLLEAIRSYYKPVAAEGEDAPWGVPQAERGNVRFVIATVPDPVHTHLALFFDRQIEAIEKAAQAEGYFFSSAWMPWDIGAHAESDDFTTRMAQSSVQSRREKFPGLLIFRTSTKDPSHPTSALFVFIVGETPTAGLHAEQFQNALRIEGAIKGVTEKSPLATEPLLIFGPTFSGSLESLDAVLSHYSGKLRFPGIVARSGTVSGFSAAHNFCQTTHAQWKANPAPVIAASAPDFATLQFSDRYEEFYLSTFFADRHQLHSKVAVLSEDETRFGNLDPTTEQKEAQPVSPDPCGDAPPKTLNPFIHLYFPREIAQLRSAYEVNLKLQPLPNQDNRLPAQTRLPLTLDLTGKDDDSVQTFAPLETPISQDAVMQSIIATLRDQHAKVVIIRASDPLDMVFLARYLRTNYQQARLVISGADLLMDYDVTDPRFHGILAVTSYPLLNGAEFPDYSRDAQEKKLNKEQPLQRSFSDAYSVGSFNAFLSLLAKSTDTKCCLFPQADYAQFGLPSFLENDGTDRPHIWLTTVGRDGYWPVSVLDAVPQEHIDELADQIQKKDPRPFSRHQKPEATVRSSAVSGVAPRTFSVHFTIGWTIFWLITFIAGLLLSFLIFFPPTNSDSETLIRFRPGATARRNWLLIAGAALLLLTQALFVFPSAIWAWHFGSLEVKDLPVSGTTCLAILGLVFLAGWVGLGWLLDKRLIQVRRDLRLYAAIALGLVLIVAVLCDELWLIAIFFLLSLVIFPFACSHLLDRIGDGAYATLRRVAFWAGLALLISLPIAWLCFHDRWSNPSELPSFIYRYIQTGSGVSPLLPLFFIMAAWIWWCWQSLTGVVSSEDRSIKLPEASSFSKELEPYDCVRLRMIADRSDWTSKTLGPFPTAGNILLFGILGFVSILALMRPSEIAEAFESIWYRRIYWYFFLYPSLFLICFLAAHIIRLWLRLRLLLQAVEALPFRRGFSDVKDLTWKPLWKLAGAGTGDYFAVLKQEVSVLGRIRNIDSQKDENKTSANQSACRTDRISYEERPDAGHPTATTVITLETVRSQPGPQGPQPEKRDTLFEDLQGSIRNVRDHTNAVASSYSRSRNLGCDAHSDPDAGRKDDKCAAEERAGRELKTRFTSLQDAMADAVGKALIYANTAWKSETPYFPEASDSSKDDGKTSPSEPPAKDCTLRAVEHFLCLFYLNVILVPLRRLQTLILALAGVFVFVLLSYSSYPFESRESFHALLISILFAISLVVGIVYGQMYRDPLLSRITNTSPGEFGLDFWVKMGSFVFIPVLSLLSVQFPEVNSILFSWLQPALQSLK
jgi:hypothetical protein